MEITIIEVMNQKIAEIISDSVLLNTAQDALDLMVEVGYQGAESMIVHEKNLNPKFFELQTGLAGEILQKHANYQIKLAIIGEFEKFQSKSLMALIVESNRGQLIFFVPDKETAIAKITGTRKRMES